VTAEQERWGAEDLDAKRAVVARLADDFGAVFVPLQSLLLDAAAQHGGGRTGNAALAADGVHPTPLGSELIAGAWLGGERGVLLLQSSGVGNCINMLSLPVICHMPLLMIVTMRGDWGEFNPWQIPMGQGTRPSLEAMGVIVNKVDEPDLVASTVQGAAHLAFNSWKPVAVLLGQRVLGAKNFKELARK
jgi:hypothetical protein